MPQLFSSDEESEIETQTKQQKSTYSSTRLEKSTANKRPKTDRIDGSKTHGSKKPRIQPVPLTNNKLTARDLFGSESDEEDSSVKPSTSTGKTPPPLHSYFTKRVNKGYARKISETKQGPYYVEVKVYNCNEIADIPPVNRWRHSIVTIKTKVDADTEMWRHLKGFTSSVEQDFRNCPATLINSYY